jgi:hypothetical protein
VSECEEFIQLVEQVTGHAGRRQGRETLLLCPAHDDHHPSLNVSEGDDGRPLVRCRSQGCSWKAIRDAIGWTSRNGDGAEWTPYGPMVKSYRYEDEGGKLLYEVCRTEGKDFPLRRPDPTSKSGWRWKLDGIRRVLYRLPDVLRAVANGETVWVVEGEKDADRLRREGVVATCNPGGAGNWRDEYAEPLRGATVRVVADRDAPGLKHARRVARSLAHVGAEVALLQPAIETEGADVSDHLARLYALDELEPLDLDTADAEQEGDPSVTFPEFVGRRDETTAEPLVVSAQGAMAHAGGLVILAAKTGDGKTTLTVEFVL